MKGNLTYLGVGSDGAHFWRLRVYVGPKKSRVHW
jgi:hypothetical protein